MAETAPSTNVHNATFGYGSKFTKLEVFALTGMVCLSLMSMSKIRAQNKQMKQAYDLLGSSLNQVAALTAQNVVLKK